MPHASTTDGSRCGTIGWVGLDAPLEVIEAAGRRPQRIAVDLDTRATNSVFGEGGGHPWMRAAIERLAQTAPTLERLVLCSTPVTELWLYNFLLSLDLRGEGDAFPATDLLNLSHERRPSARRLNVQGLGALARRLKPDFEATGLHRAIAARNRVRAALRRVDGLRGAHGGINGVEARRRMDPADNLISEDYLAWVGAQPEPAAGAPGRPVIFSGPGVPSLELYAALERRGFTIVGDDADVGSRAIGPDAAEAGDPFTALADRYAHRSPAPAGWPTGERVGWLVDLAKARGAEAVLFDLPPWSHPAAWDYPAERQALKAQGIAAIELPRTTPDDAADAAHRALETAHV